MSNSDYRNHPALARKLQAYLRWRNAQGSLPRHAGRPAWDEQFSLTELNARLDGAEWYDDQAFAEYGLSAEQITDLRRWAQAWASDILRRTNAETYEEDDDEPI